MLIFGRAYIFRGASEFYGIDIELTQDSESSISPFRIHSVSNHTSVFSTVTFLSHDNLQ